MTLSELGVIMSVTCNFVLQSDSIKTQNQERTLLHFTKKKSQLQIFVLNWIWFSIIIINLKFHVNVSHIRLDTLSNVFVKVHCGTSPPTK